MSVFLGSRVPGCAAMRAEASLFSNREASRPWDESEKSLKSHAVWCADLHIPLQGNPDTSAPLSTETRFLARQFRCMQLQLPVPAIAALPRPPVHFALTAQAPRKPTPPVASSRCSRVGASDVSLDLPYRRWLQWSGNL